MELKINRTAVCAAAPTGSIRQEQGVELDYVLPDYYPDVCKLVGCFLTPAILSEVITGDRLSYELRAEVRILYCSENSNLLQCVTQTLLFSRTADLPAGEDVTAELLPTVDYVNCRAVSKRRLDVRGAVTVRIRTASGHRQEVLTDVQGRGAQQRRIPVQLPAKRLSAAQSIIVTEDLEQSGTQPALLHVVRVDARPTDITHKLVSGKLMVQGDLRLHLLYACEREGDGSLEPLSFTLPFSQLLDMDGMEEQDCVRITCTAAGCDIKPSADPDGAVRALRCEAELRVHCLVTSTATEQLVCDAFSTEHPCTCRTAELLTCTDPQPFHEMQVCSARLTCADSELDCVYDAWCEVRNLTNALQGEDIVLSGMLVWNVLVRDTDRMPRLLTREEPFGYRFSPGGMGEDDQLQVNARAENCTYTLNSAAEVALKAELRMEGSVTHCRRMNVLTELEVQEDAAHPRDYALKLYYGTQGEPVWDIARRCHTSVEAIMDENELTGDTLTETGMLLIPIVN